MIGTRPYRCLYKLLSKPGAITYLTTEEWRYMQQNAERDPILVEREKTHGSFTVNARISQSIKVIFSANNYYVGLNDSHKEALDMIALKLSRILSGQSNFKDHWDDIAGYAKLGAEACDAKE